LEFKLQGLVGDTLVAAASVAYIGPFTAKYRKELVSLWEEMCRTAEIPISDKFDLVKSTVDAHLNLQFIKVCFISIMFIYSNTYFVK
jgi:dynein heavy chain